jgi:peptidoglycan hydrolase CwlO-like protein
MRREPSGHVIVHPIFALFGILASVLLVSSFGLFAAQPAAATPLTDAQQRVRDVKQQISRLDTRLDLAVARYAEATQALLAVKADIRHNRRQLKLARFNVASAKDALQRRVVAIYKERPVDMLDVLVGAGSFDELLSKLAMMNHLTAGDARLIKSVEVYERQVASERGALDQKLADAKRLVTHLSAQKASIAATLTQRRAALRGAQAGIRDLLAAPSPRPVASASPTPDGGQGVWWGLIKAAARANGIDAGGLYRLMMVESGGDAYARNGSHCGLFQYTLSTWKGSWNPWRSAGIFGGAAQIKATALALRLGYGPGWWPSTYSYAFSR